MRKKSYYALAGAVALAIMIGAGAARAGGEQGRSPTWALGNIVHGLANALNGPSEAGRAGQVDLNPGLQAGKPAPDGARPQDKAATRRVAATQDGKTSF